MKRSKIFIAVGAFLLAITALLSTKANKKFGGPNTAFFAGSGYYITNLSSLNLTVTHGTGYYAVGVTLRTGTTLIHGQQLKTSGGTNLYRHD
jgi:hypothetical protein